MLIKCSFSAYHLYSKNVALLCLGGIEVTLPSTWRRRPSYKFVLVCCFSGSMQNLASREAYMMKTQSQMAFDEEACTELLKRERFVNGKNALARGATPQARVRTRPGGTKVSVHTCIYRDIDNMYPWMPMGDILSLLRCSGTFWNYECDAIHVYRNLGSKCMSLNAN